MNKKKAQISIIMAAYNAEKYISESIESILDQTYKKFELIIINDGSTDGTLSLIKKFRDTRVILINNKNNLGKPISRNRGIKKARGEYIAIMDADDISLRYRLKSQINFKKSHKNIGACGSWAKTIGDSNYLLKHPTDPEEIKARLFFENTFVHSSVMFRRKLLDRFNLKYDTAYKKVQDYDLLTRCSFLFPLGNLPKILVIYRDTKNKEYYQNSYQKYIDMIRRKNLKRLGIFNLKNLEIYKKICLLKKNNSSSSVVNVSVLLKNIYQQNKELRIYPLNEFEEEISDRWANICMKSSGMGMSIFVQYLTLNPVRKFDLGNKRRMVYLFRRCLFRKS